MMDEQCFHFPSASFSPAASASIASSWQRSNMRCAMPISSSKIWSSVSSILPPQCELIPRQLGVAALSPGEITFCVMARSETNEFGRLVASGIGLARPKQSSHYGYISEHHAFGMSEADASEYVEDLAASMLASTLGIEFNPDAAWDERKRVYEMSSLIVDTQSIASAAVGAPRGEWTCVVAAAVFLFSAGDSVQS